MIGEAVEVGAETEHSAGVVNSFDAFVIANVEAKGVVDGFAGV